MRKPAVATRWEGKADLTYFLFSRCVPNHTPSSASPAPPGGQPVNMLMWNGDICVCVTTRAEIARLHIDSDKASLCGQHGVYARGEMKTVSVQHAVPFCQIRGFMWPHRGRGGCWRPGWDGGSNTKSNIWLSERQIWTVIYRLRKRGTDTL